MSKTRGRIGTGRVRAGTGRILTLQTLIDKGACSSQVELFRTTFGDSVRVTLKLARQMADRFDWGCAAEQVSYWDDDGVPA